MEPQLYMWSGTRDLFLRRHRFFVDQVKVRVLSQFQTIEADAEAYSESEYDRLASLPGDENSDMADVAEAANDRGQEFYGLLHDMKKQMMLAALAAMYHQWDKDLRDFIERELVHYYEGKAVADLVWKQDVGKIFDLLREFGWDCRASSFFDRIEACRLIVNVYKHGKGRSLDDLARSFPQYLNHPFVSLAEKPSFAADFLDYEWVEISDDQFDEMAKAISWFWEEFPERLFLKVS